ncbi:hypothetical protein ACFYW9_26220 [Streptomyces sp. NPDC002698]|uniref:hypothetical protein n=1 Tax=Streptomyces sp. NPDC002698 TaxID=3364660 RepID=UPI0036A6A675
MNDGYWSIALSNAVFDTLAGLLSGLVIAGALVWAVGPDIRVERVVRQRGFRLLPSRPDRLHLPGRPNRLGLPHTKERSERRPAFVAERTSAGA